MDISVRITISAVLLITFMVSQLLYKWIKKKHSEDPVYLEEQKRREEAYRKKIEEENEILQNYDFSGDDYSDDDVNDFTTID